MGNRLVPSPANQRRYSNRAMKKKMREERKARDKKMEDWRSKPVSDWTMERRVATGQAWESDWEEMKKELETLKDESQLTDEAQNEITAQKRQAANLKGRITKAQKKTAAEKMKDPKTRAEGIEIAEGEIEELGVALANKEQEVKRQEAELTKLVDPKKRRRLAWLKRWLNGRG